MNTRDTGLDFKEFYDGEVPAAQFSKINHALLAQQVRSLDELCSVGDLAQSFNQNGSKEGQDLFLGKPRLPISGWG